MKSSYRIFLTSAIVVLVLFGMLWTHLADLADQYRFGSYIRTSMKQLLLEVPQRQALVGGQGADKVIVMAKMEKEDATWVARELPEYVADPLPRQARKDTWLREFEHQELTKTSIQLATSNLYC